MRVASPSGKAYIVLSGAYDMQVQKEFVVDAVDTAVALIEAEGVKAFETLRDKRSQFIFQDTYIFVIEENETTESGFPKTRGTESL